MALAKGKSKIRTGPISLHTKTAIHIAELLTSVNLSSRVMNMNVQKCIVTGEIPNSTRCGSGVNDVSRDRV